MLISSSWKIEDYYERGEQIGQGGFGEVVKVTDKITREEFVLKLLPKFLIYDDEMKEYITREVSIQKELQHPNVLRLLDCHMDEKHLCLKLPYCRLGSLHGLWKKQHKGMMPEPLAARFVRIISYALEYLHRENIVHRDVKLQNILLDDNLSPLLADFGLAARFNKYKSRDTTCGTDGYRSPEMLNGKGYMDTVDGWAVGIVLYVLLLGRFPFNGKNQNADIMCGSYEIPPQKISSGAEHLIQSLLTVDPYIRLPVQCLPGIQWIKENQKIEERAVSKMLKALRKRTMQ